jgi:hypothetical protein
MARSLDEILLFLVKNSTPEYHEFPVSSRGALEGESKDELLKQLLLALSGTTRYLCPEKALREFLGEPISFERHLRPFHRKGILFFDDCPEKGSFYDSKKYRDLFDGSSGRVQDPGSKKTWVAFHYRENDFLEHVEQIEKDAFKLGLFSDKETKNEP